MPILTSADTARIAADMLTVWPETATILRATNTTDSMGGRSRAWSSVGTTPARISAIKKYSETLIAGQLRDHQQFQISTPNTADIRLTDRVQISGVVYAVVEIRAPQSISLENHIICERAPA